MSDYNETSSLWNGFARTHIVISLLLAAALLGLFLAGFGPGGSACAAPAAATSNAGTTSGTAAAAAAPVAAAADIETAEPVVEAYEYEGLPAARVYFDVDSSEMPNAALSYEWLSEVIAHLEANPDVMATISGFHDPTGDYEHNQALARDRATTVRDVLMAEGIEEARLDRVKPIETTGTGNYAEARRVEVTLRPIN